MTEGVGPKSQAGKHSRQRCHMVKQLVQSIFEKDYKDQCACGLAQWGGQKEMRMKEWACLRVGHLELYFLILFFLKFFSVMYTVRNS